ncbi:MAG: hypothetical protein WCZ66_00285 [Sphingomonadaceae bacterium]
MGATFPDGIDADDVRPRRIFPSHSSPFSLLVLGGILLLAMTGWAGGQPNRIFVEDTDGVRLEVSWPKITRNGLIFETRIRIEPKRPVDDLVLGVSSSLWRDITINSMIPAATGEESRRGLFRFSYGTAEAGEVIEIKIDGQINPPLFGGTQGHIAIFDDEVELARIPLTMEVRP